MNTRRLAVLPGLLAAALLVVGCSESVSPDGPDYWFHPPPPPTRARFLAFTVSPVGAEARTACAVAVGGDVITVEVSVLFEDDFSTDVSFAGPVDLTIEDDASALGSARLCGPPIVGTNVLTAVASQGVASFTFGIDQPSSIDFTDPGLPLKLYSLRASAGLGITDAISSRFCMSLGLEVICNT